MRRAPVLTPADAARPEAWRCAGKQSHDTRGDAEKHAVSLRRRRDSPVQPYRCPDCGLWHVGNRR